MSAISGNTTLVCVFHSKAHADAAIKDLQENGIPADSISTVSKSETSGELWLEKLGVERNEAEHLRQGFDDGGTVVLVSTYGAHADTTERIFHKHDAVKVDDSDIDAAGIAKAPHDREVLEANRTRVYRRSL